MIVEVKQLKHFAKHYISELFIDGKFFCFVLQDTLRGHGEKIHGETAIPLGEYKLGIRYSPRFKRSMISIYTEPDKETIIKNGVSFKFVMFHGGNKAADTEGCPLVAYKLMNGGHDGIYTTAEAAFFKKVSPEILAKKEVRAIFS